MLAFVSVLLVMIIYKPLAFASDIEDQDSLQYVRQLPGVDVISVRNYGRDKIDYLSISGAEINKRPVLLGEHDVIKALQSSPGVVAGTEGFAGLYVRGGETDQNLYLLDGLPLLNVYHFGGLFSTFSTNSINRVNFYKGSFPSAFGERASSIVDVAMKSPDFINTKGEMTVGLISGQMYLSTPIKKGCSAFSISLRRTWLDLFAVPILAILNASKKRDGKKTIFNYNFTDLSVKFNASDHNKNDFSIILFFGKDNFKLGSERFDPDEESSVYRKDINHMIWGNWGLSSVYRLSTGIGNLTIQPYLSKSFSSDAEENMRNEGDNGDKTATTKICPSVFQVGMREILRFPIHRSLEGEIGMQQTWFRYKVGNPTSSYSGSDSNPMFSSFSDNSYNTLLSAFSELYWNFPDLFSWSAGLRINRYLSNELRHWNLEPRITVKTSLPYESSISVGFSRMTQYAQQVSSNYMYLPSDAWLPTANYQKPLICNILTIGFFKDFKKDFSAKGEVWWKNMHNLAEYGHNSSATTNNIQWYDKLTYGKGWAYGCDLELNGKYKSLNWNVAYGLMWNWRKFPGINSGKRYPAKFDNRHKLNISFAWEINERLELNGQWEYMTGNRTTLALYNIAPPDIAFPDSPFVNPIDMEADRQDGLDFYENRNNVRIPSFHRLNVSLCLKGKFNKNLKYKWTFGLYNAYCRLNPFTLIKSYQNLDWSHKGDYRKFKTLSLIPILPSVTFTLNF